MSTIKLSLLFSGSLGEKKLLTLFDDVATYSCIDANMLHGLANQQKMARSKCAVSSFYKDGIEVVFVTLLDFYINGVRVSDEFLVVPNLNEQVVIGNLTIRKWRMKIDKQNHSVEVDDRAMILRI
jgi:archaeosine-15-forming tRNA-guanine transglycosylase